MTYSDHERTDESCGHGQSDVQPRIIIHGGAGHVSRDNLSPEAWEAYRIPLQRILRESRARLARSSALDVAVFAVQELEKEPLFNAGKGAVFTTDGTHELEASVMVSRGHYKRGVGVNLLKHVKSPITLAAEMLRRGDRADGGGAHSHVQLGGAVAEDLARAWGLELVPQSYFWTKKRWQEHRRGLGKAAAGDESDDHDDDEPGWDGKEYLPQGTVGAVVLDNTGTIAAATSTGGVTNKLPGRIGDTPTLGAGFWAEQWEEETGDTAETGHGSERLWPRLSARGIASTARGHRSLWEQLSLDAISGCLPFASTSAAAPGADAGPAFQADSESEKMEPYTDAEPGVREETMRLDRCTSCAGHETRRDQPVEAGPRRQIRAVGMSGTGHGDSFLRLNAARTVAARARFSSPHASLADCVSWMAGSGGEMQRSVGERWQTTLEGEGGIIGIECICPVRGDGDGKATNSPYQDHDGEARQLGCTSDCRLGHQRAAAQTRVVFDFNCGGLFRAYIDDHGQEHVAVFKD